MSQSDKQKVATKKLDELEIKPYKVIAKPDIFETAFYKGTKINEDSFLLSFYAIDIGKIKIESGKIIACDPIRMHDAKPFIQSFPIGQFSVQLAIVKTKNDERVAFSRIYFSDKPVAKWEFALDTLREQIPIYGETLIGYGVDGGIGLFIDEKANTLFNEILKKDDNIFEKVFTEEMDKNSASNWQFVLYNFGEHNLASFTTGEGDGHYGTYIGYDDNGQPCRLLTDFGYVSWWTK